MVLSGESKHIDYKAGQILLIDKPLDWTSFDVVNKVRYALKPFTGKIKVGHAGTLDPRATGLLILCTGKMTKRIESFVAAEKAYSGTFFIGATTPSFDREKAVDQTFETIHITDELIRKTALQFTGTIQQLPPIFSAVKKDGEPLYAKARRGEKVEVTPRTVHIHQFEITEIKMPLVGFKVTCSKGTYIRSLANDFGKELASGAYLDTLVRTRIGEFKLEDSWQLDELIDFIKFTASQFNSDEGFQRP